MAKPPQVFFLEEWLRSIINKNGSAHPSSHSSAQAIIQAWADLRDSSQHRTFDTRHLQALKTLVGSQSVLYVADPQAKLITSILSLSSHGLSLPEESFPLLIRLLYVWVRKSRQTSSVVNSAVNVLVDLLSRQSHFEKNALFISEGILLLGALAFQSSASEKSKSICLDLLCKFLEEDIRFVFSSDEMASVALAGAGYALSSPLKICFRRILEILLCFWGRGGQIGVSQGLMLLHLMEWVVSNILRSRFVDKIEILRDVLENAEPAYSSYAVIMAAAGVLKAVNRSGTSGFMYLSNCAEERIEIVARSFVPRSRGFDYDENKPGANLLLHFMAIALSQSGSVSHKPSFLISLALALLTEVFPLQHFYNKILRFPDENRAAVLDEINGHLSSFIFKEAGSITGVFCNQYASADDDSRSTVENLIWDYCQEVYSWHRQTRVLLVGRADNLIREIEKIAESAFLMVVVFALGVTKHRFGPNIDRESQLEISLRVLISFSCMEYFRRMRLPEYMDAIRAVVVSVQENESACAKYIESMPSYDDVINNHGSSNFPKSDYLWSSDEVQTARIIFYMRVIPTCVDRLPASTFKKVVAPTMFLYMGHPNGKVARYTHSAFVAFMASGKDPTHDERALLKEQLVFYYIQRSLEGFPGITPFEGMASGVAALVRHLPAGSPAIFCCIHSLVEKATSLCSTISRHDSHVWKNWEGELEPPKKLLDLLLRLLSLVDIQVLPTLMKLLAQLIVQLPLNGQNSLLNQLYQQIADSDDVIRKPALVSWVQSLSYLCSQGANKKNSSLSSISMNRISSRL
ncbi:disease resistance protein (TIR-NBS-LRR class)family [Striga asiatica]|uniref:Disease resistance protein (TIR-NBS-LRR class)family n=1 Tax=Striga asiatica TaxID=4170 RepID=A0A5A7PNV4_STRAF|nr:disease resistance protein (TIR-NBS-LRR class)family [Striga asiatica]